MRSAALQSMAMVLRSYATLNFTPHELLDAAAEHMALNLPQYSTQASTAGPAPLRLLPQVCAASCGTMFVACRDRGSAHVHGCAILSGRREINLAMHDVELP